MKYMLLIYAEEQAWSDSERELCYRQSSELAHELNASRQYVYASPLQPVSTATTLRMRGGRPMITDGPFAETREQLGGFFLIEAKNLDEAIAVAQRLPAAPKSTVEIRPVVEVPELPTSEPTAVPQVTVTD